MSARALPVDLGYQPRLTWLTGLILLAILLLTSTQAFSQDRQDRDGVTLYWGLVPAAIMDDKHAIADLHGGPRKDGGVPHHLVVAVFDTASGRRIDDAVVRAKLSEPGIVDEAPKYLPQMPVNGQVSYGQWFTTVARSGPYRFRVFVKLPGGPGEIEFALSAGAPHDNMR